MKIKNSLFLFVLLAIPFIALASSCEQITKVNLKLQSADTNTPSLTRYQLQNAVGKPNKTITLKTEYFYQWKPYQIWTTSDGATEVVGTYPGRVNVKEMGPKSAEKALGKPIALIADHQTQYQWSCSNGTKLTIVAYDSGVLKNANGTTCVNNQCTPFSLNFNTTSKARQLFDQNKKSILNQ